MTLYIVLNIYEDVSWEVELVTANWALAEQRCDSLRLEVLISEKAIGPDQNLAEAWEHYSTGLQTTNITIAEYEYEPGSEPENDPLTPWLS